MPRIDVNLHGGPMNSSALRHVIHSIVLRMVAMRGSWVANLNCFGSIYNEDGSEQEWWAWPCEYTHFKKPILLARIRNIEPGFAPMKKA